MCDALPPCSRATKRKRDETMTKLETRYARNKEVTELGSKILKQRNEALARIIVLEEAVKKTQENMDKTIQQINSAWVRDELTRAMQPLAALLGKE